MEPSKCPKAAGFSPESRDSCPSFKSSATVPDRNIPSSSSSSTADEPRNIETSFSSSEGDIEPQNHGDSDPECQECYEFSRLPRSCEPIEASGDSVIATETEGVRPVLIEESTVEIFDDEEDHPDDPMTIPSDPDHSLTVTDSDIRSRSCWDHILARSLASDEIEAVQVTDLAEEMERRLMKTDSHSSGRSSSISGSSEAVLSETGADPLEESLADMQEDPKDPDDDMDLDLEAGAGGFQPGYAGAEASRGCNNDLLESGKSRFESAPGMYPDDEGVDLICQENTADRANSPPDPNDRLEQESSIDYIEIISDHPTTDSPEALISPRASTSFEHCKPTKCVSGCNVCSNGCAMKPSGSNTEERMDCESRSPKSLTFSKTLDEQLNIAGPSGLNLARNTVRPTRSRSGHQLWRKPGDTSSSNDCGHTGNSDSPFHCDCRFDQEKAYERWTLSEAHRRAPRQIGSSSCGSVAVAAVLELLGCSRNTKSSPDQCIPVRLRANNAKLAEYLVSRSIAGTTHEDLIDGMLKLTEGRIRGRFFATFPPKRHVHFAHFLCEWLQKGAIPVLTMNLQRAPFLRNVGPFLEEVMVVPDAWHHQPVFSADPSTGKVGLLNPIEKVDEEFLQRVLEADRVLLIRANDVIARWNGKGIGNFKKILDASLLDPRWTEMNVIGQIVSVIREASQTDPVSTSGTPQSLFAPGSGTPTTGRLRRTTHIAIPAAYHPGITLFAPEDSPVWKLIQEEPELQEFETHLKRIQSDCSDLK